MTSSVVMMLSQLPIGENQGCDNQKQGCNKILQPDKVVGGLVHTL